MASGFGAESWGIGPFTVALKQLDLCQSGSRPVNDHKGGYQYESRKRSRLLYCLSLGRNLSDCQWQTSQNDLSIWT